MERALRIDEASYGPDHPVVAIRLSNLATILQDMGDAAVARPLLERALRIDEASYGLDHPRTALIREPAEPCRRRTKHPAREVIDSADGRPVAPALTTAWRCCGRMLQTGLSLRRRTGHGGRRCCRMCWQ
jgi:hypothetical protein